MTLIIWYIEAVLAETLGHIERDLGSDVREQ